MNWPRIVNFRSKQGIQQQDIAKPHQVNSWMSRLVKRRVSVRVCELADEWVTEFDGWIGMNVYERTLVSGFFLRVKDWVMKFANEHVRRGMSGWGIILMKSGVVKRLKANASERNTEIMCLSVCICMGIANKRASEWKSGSEREKERVSCIKCFEFHCNWGFCSRSNIFWAVYACLPLSQCAIHLFTIVFSQKGVKSSQGSW